ncbi:hypothetical protein [Mesorhizobium temperatum]|uniref:Uncharacterized protein n=1 Tax=Mesorhizobium temperatum TaxID=241416 RepID=A0A271LQ95_9HYPH|nr:hypothetical protein [Mesorhizobium temperatum]PAQ10293.1 hypothetical protein CIT26_09105 [Mesorhizobium temperatum]
MSRIFDRCGWGRHRVYLTVATLVHWQEIPEAVRSAIVETATSSAFPDLPRTTSLHEQIAQQLVRYSGENRD